MAEQISVEVGLDEVDDEAAIRRAVARACRRPPAELADFTVRRRSLDARRGRVRFRLLVELEPEQPIDFALPVDVRGSNHRVVVVGDGPAGLFCAYQLARCGIASVVLDRGYKVQRRRRDLKKLNQNGIVDRNSNYCFGEGGAGTYSDGKLYTRANKRGNVSDIIATLLHAGAPGDIAIDARPHIGSNKLPKVVTALREELESVGVEFRFEARVERLLVESGELRGVGLEGGETITGDAVVIATGHSARDVFDMLIAAGVSIEPKPFALGVRIEHPQPLINEIQYGKAAKHPRLPAASYRLASDVDGRGVFSFCMCPGGWIVPAATEPDGLVVNGMSLSRRDSPHANSGMVVAVELEDIRSAGFEGPLAGVELQQKIEREAYRHGGGALRAPATRLTDFLASRGSTTVPDSSYIPGLTAGDVAETLDCTGLELSARLRSGLRDFSRRMRGFLTKDAVLVGVESRTSCPIRVLRDKTSLESPDLARLYPCGEGAGYAGGIVSAAIDGVRVATAIAAHFNSTAT